MPVFVGRRHQRGHGLAQTVGGLFKRFVVPFVAPYAKHLGKQILGNAARTGLEVVGDVVGGRNPKEAIKGRALSGIKRTIDGIVSQSPFDVGRDDDKATKHPRPKKKKVLSRKRKDVFG